MNNLDQKFRNNKISVHELEELRKKINSMNDSELEELLSNSWFNEDIDVLLIENERIEKIKKNIEETIGKGKRRIFFPLPIARIAIAVLMLVSISTMFYLYNENSKLASEELIVSTNKNERANITLPDGTTVVLNSDSRLNYIPKIYNAKERKISFDGEGYFHVYKDPKRPFLINTKGMEVRVLGTSFNLLVRKSKNIAELALEEGSVSLQSILTNETVILEPNQKAMLNQETGEITIIKDSHIQDISAWRKGNLVFRNATLTTIIRTIEENYNVDIKLECEDCLNDTFTGTMPISNLNEVLEIIEKSYHMQSVIKGNEIVLKSF